MHSDDFDKRMRDRLQAYEEEPNTDAWAGIQSELERAPQQLSRRLAGYEDTPDETVWKKINAQQRLARGLWWTEQGSTIAAWLLVLWLPFGMPSSKPVGFVNEGKKTFSPSLTPDSVQSGGRISLSDAKSARHRDSKAALFAIVDSFDGAPTEVKPATPIVLQPESERESPTMNSISNVTQNPNRSALIERSKKDETAIDSLAATFDDITPTEEIASADETKKRESTSSFYFLAMPTLGYQQVSPVLNDGIIVESYERVASFSPRRLGVRVELGWEQKISPHLSVDLALLYFQRKQTIGYTYLDSVHYRVAPVDEAPLTYEISPEPLPGSFDYEVRNVGMLVGFNYTIKSGGFTQRLGVASELHKNLKRDAFYLFGDAYYRLSYQVGPRVEFMVQPTFNYTLRLIDNLNAPFYVKPYGLGISLGAMVRVGGSPNKE